MKGTEPFGEPNVISRLKSCCQTHSTPRVGPASECLTFQAMKPGKNHCPERGAQHSEALPGLSRLCSDISQSYSRTGIGHRIMRHPQDLLLPLGFCSWSDFLENSFHSC